MHIFMLDFILEIMKYGLGYHMFFSMKLRRTWISVLGMLLYVMLSLTGMSDDIDLQQVILFMIVILTTFLVADEKGYQKVLHILLLIFVITCIDAMIGVVLGQFYVYFMGKTLPLEVEYIITSLLTLLLLSIIAIIKKMYISYNNDRIKRIIWKSVNVFVLIMAMSMMLSVAGLRYASELIINKKFDLFSAVISLIAFFSIALLGIFIIYIKNLNEQIGNYAEMEKKLKEMQKKHYEALLEKEQDTRDFRHDLNEHLVCLNELVEAEDLEALKIYVGKISEQMSVIQNKSYHTGNRVLDIFVNYYAQGLEDAVIVSVTGKCIRLVEIDEIDMCTIFSNLLHNAAEVLMQEGNSQKYLKISIRQRKKYLQVQIINTVADNYADYGEKSLITKKDDKKNHGIGLKNVRETIKRNGGSLEIKIDNGEFIAVVII